MNNEEIVQKLSEYFKVKPEEIKNICDNIYEINDKEYLVFDDYDKAYETAIEYCKNTLEDVGIDCVNGYENFMDEECLDEMQQEYYIEYCENIKEEESDSIFKNRLIEECYNHSIIFDEDFETDEYDEINYNICLVNEDIMIENYVNYLCRQESSIDWIKDLYTMKDIQKYFPNAFDINEIAEYCVDVDGIANELSSYDGKEIQYKGLYLYRVN